MILLVLILFLFLLRHLLNIEPLGHLGRIFEIPLRYALRDATLLVDHLEPLLVLQRTLMLLLLKSGLRCCRICSYFILGINLL